MCRKADFCTELGTDPSKWSTRTPLEHPTYFLESLENFIKSFELAKKQQIAKSLSFLEKTRSNDLRTWFVEHGQMSGWHHRAKVLQKPRPPIAKENIEKRTSFANIAKEIFIRDGYVCRYCETRVIDVKALTQLEKLLGEKVFKATGRTNQSRHGIALVFRATIDHVQPVSFGGLTTFDNLVTACWSCNYGKLDKTIDEIGIMNPRDFVPSSFAGWTGLT